MLKQTHKYLQQNQPISFITLIITKLIMRKQSRSNINQIRLKMMGMNKVAKMAWSLYSNTMRRLETTGMIEQEIWNDKNGFNIPLELDEYRGIPLESVVKNPESQVKPIVDYQSKVNNLKIVNFNADQLWIKSVALLSKFDPATVKNIVERNRVIEKREHEEKYQFEETFSEFIKVAKDGMDQVDSIDPSEMYSNPEFTYESEFVEEIKQSKNGPEKIDNKLTQEKEGIKENIKTEKTNINTRDRERESIIPKRKMQEQKIAEKKLNVKIEKNSQDNEEVKMSPSKIGKEGVKEDKKETTIKRKDRNEMNNQSKNSIEKNTSKERFYSKNTYDRKKYQYSNNKEYRNFQKKSDQTQS